MPDEQPTVYQSAMSNDSQAIAEMTKGFSRMVETMSTVNIDVPKIDHYDDVHKFINEFETATVMLTSENKLKLIVKAFSTGSYKIWFESELKTRLENQNITWESVKRKIIERYSLSDSKDRYFRRLQALKFTPGEGRHLYDHIEEAIYIIKHTLPSIGEDTKVSFIKNTLPNSILPKLDMIIGYSEAKTIDDLKKAARRYDIQCSNCQVEESKVCVKPINIAEIVEAVMKGIKEEVKSNRELIAAFQERPSRSQSPRFAGNQVRQPSSNNYGQNYNQSQVYHTNRDRQVSPYNRQSGQRSPSPARRFDDNNYKQQQYYGTSNGRAPSPKPPSNYPNSYQNNQINQAGISHNNNSGISMINSRAGPQSSDTQMAFDSEEYWATFKKPPSPCDCGLWHWREHCIKNGNLKSNYLK